MSEKKTGATPVPIIRLPESCGVQSGARFAEDAGHWIDPTGESRESFIVKEWRGSGPATLHVHHSDYEAWHVLEGVLHFRFADREVDVAAGGTVFVPAGVPHTYSAIDARYLIVLTPRLEGLIAELQSNRDPAAQHDIYAKYDSTLLE
jgi:mannose-6-phosphate isomerase-like protein (cupin superfamily)